MKKLIIILLLFSITAQVTSVCYMKRCEVKLVHDIDEKKGKDSKNDKKEDKVLRVYLISFQKDVSSDSSDRTAKVNLYASPLMGPVTPPPDAV